MSTWASTPWSILMIGISGGDGAQVELLVEKKGRGFGEMALRIWASKLSLPEVNQLVAVVEVARGQHVLGTKFARNFT